jgi:hypothetical protein
MTRRSLHLYSGTPEDPDRFSEVRSHLPRLDVACQDGCVLAYQGLNRLPSPGKILACGAAASSGQCTRESFWLTEIRKAVRNKS